MDEDTTDAAWHQQELDEYHELLTRDAGYLEWLASIEHLRKDTYEIPCESYV